jgi:GTPase SAR1 family protein
MEINMPFPTEIIEPTVTISYRILSTLLKAQVSVFAFGAEKTGKTSFVRRLEGSSSLREIFSAGESSGVDPRRVWVNPNPSQQSHSINLFFIDMGGQSEFARLRRKELSRFLPLGILFFLDHRLSDEKGQDAEQIDDGTIDPQRMLRHKEALNELISAIGEQPQVRKACQAIIFVVNKSDLWQARVSKDDFSIELRPEIARLIEVSQVRTMPSMMSCSVKTGEGIMDIMRTLFRLSGWEVPLPFGKKVRFIASLWK